MCRCILAKSVWNKFFKIRGQIFENLLEGKMNHVPQRGGLFNAAVVDTDKYESGVHFRKGYACILAFLFRFLLVIKYFKINYKTIFYRNNKLWNVSIVLNMTLFRNFFVRSIYFTGVTCKLIYLIMSYAFGIFNICKL